MSNRTIAFYVVLLLLTVAVFFYILKANRYSEDSRLYGRWQSDLSESMDWNTANLKLDSNEVKDCRQRFGNLTMVFEPKGRSSFIMLPHEYSSEAGIQYVAGYSNKVNYYVVEKGQRHSFVKLKSDRFDCFYYLHFEGADTLWLTDGNAGDLPREYFRKAPLPPQK